VKYTLREQKFLGTKVTQSNSSIELSFLGAKGRGAKGAGSKLARVRLAYRSGERISLGVKRLGTYEITTMSLVVVIVERCLKQQSFYLYFSMM